MISRFNSPPPSWVGARARVRRGLFVFGGEGRGTITDTTDQSEGVALRTVEQYIPQLDTWVTCQNMPIGGRRAFASWGIEGRGYVTGGDMWVDPALVSGADPNSPQRVPVRSAQTLEFIPPLSWNTRQTMVLGVPPLASSACVASSKMGFSLGGRGLGSPPGYQSDIVSYSPRVDLWRHRGTGLPQGRRNFNGVALQQFPDHSPGYEDERIFTFGGQMRFSSDGRRDGRDNEILEYNPRTEVVRNVGVLDTDVERMGVEAVGNVAYLYGGNVAGVDHASSRTIAFMFNGSRVERRGMLIGRANFATFADHEACYAIGGEGSTNVDWQDEGWPRDYGIETTVTRTTQRYTPALDHWGFVHHLQHQGHTHYIGAWLPRLWLDETNEWVTMEHRRFSRGLSI